MNSIIKRSITAFLLAFSLLLTLFASENSYAASVRLNKKSITLQKGKTYTLKVKGSSKKVKWSSANKKIATVNKNGKVTAKKAGTTKITAKVSSKKLICKVKVKTYTTPVVSPSVPTATAAPSKVPTVTPAPTTTPTLTEENVYTQLNALRTTYPEGMSLTNSNYSYSSKTFGTGFGCYGFAAKLSDTVFGTQKDNYTTHSSFSQIKVGDNIRISNSHSVIVLTKSTDYITVVEGNFNSSVHWDRKITSTSLSSSGFSVCSRY